MVDWSLHACVDSQSLILGHQLHIPMFGYLLKLFF